MRFYNGKNENWKNLFITFGGFWGVAGWIGCIFVNLYIFSKLNGQAAKSKKEYEDSVKNYVEINEKIIKSKAMNKEEVREEEENPKDK